MSPDGDALTAVDLKMQVVGKRHPAPEAAERRRVVQRARQRRGSHAGPRGRRVVVLCFSLTGSGPPSQRALRLLGGNEQGQAARRSHPQRADGKPHLARARAGRLENDRPRRRLRFETTSRDGFLQAGGLSVVRAEQEAERFEERRRPARSGERLAGGGRSGKSQPRASATPSAATSSTPHPARTPASSSASSRPSRRCSVSTPAARSS